MYVRAYVYTYNTNSYIWLRHILLSYVSVFFDFSIFCNDKRTRIGFLRPFNCPTGGRRSSYHSCKFFFLKRSVFINQTLEDENYIWALIIFLKPIIHSKWTTLMNLPRINLFWKGRIEHDKISNDIDDFWDPGASYSLLTFSLSCRMSNVDQRIFWLHLELLN